MRKKLSIFFLVIILLTYGCQPIGQNQNVEVIPDETIDLKENISTVDRDEMITEVLETAFTVIEDDYAQNEIDYKNFYEERHNKVQKYFTEKGFNRTMNSRTMAGLMYVYSDNQCTSVIEDLELTFRETSNTDQMVCYYEFNLKVTFVESSVEPFDEQVSGEMTLEKVENAWAIDYFTITTANSFYRNYSNYVKENNLDTNKNHAAHSMMANVVNQLSSSSSQLLIQNIEDDSYVILFNNTQIKSGQKESEFYSIINYDHIEYNLQENSVLFHINSEVDLNDLDGKKTIDVDYFVKIIIDEHGISYLYKYDSDEMIESQWQYVKPTNQ